LGLAAALACKGSESVVLPPPVDGAFSSVTTGLLHTCGITSTNHVYCWGWNRDGEIGDGSMKDQPYATEVSPALTFSVVTTGVGHSCAVATGGPAHWWGLNLTGPVGDTSTASRPVCSRVAGGLRFLPVSTVR